MSQPTTSAKRSHFRIPLSLGLSLSIAVVLLVQNIWLTRELTVLKSTKSEILRDTISDNRRLPPSSASPCPEPAQPQHKAILPVEPPVAVRTSASESGKEGRKLFLLVLVPTVNRAISTLLPVLQSILRQVCLVTCRRHAPKNMVFTRNTGMHVHEPRILSSGMHANRHAHKDTFSPALCGIFLDTYACIDTFVHTYMHTYVHTYRFPQILGTL